MNYREIMKFGEIQYLKGRLDELYKGYVPNFSDTNNRIVDSRISKYEEKLRKIDITSYYSFQVEKVNRFYSKEKGKKEMKDLLNKVLTFVDNEEIINDINKQIEKY
jgi:hypothetical protein